MCHIGPRSAAATSAETGHPSRPRPACRRRSPVGRLAPRAPLGSLLATFRGSQTGVFVWKWGNSPQSYWCCHESTHFNGHLFGNLKCLEKPGWVKHLFSVGKTKHTVKVRATWPISIIIQSVRLIVKSWNPILGAVWVFTHVPDANVELLSTTTTVYRSNQIHQFVPFIITVYPSIAIKWKMIG